MLACLCQHSRPKCVLEEGLCAVPVGDEPVLRGTLDLHSLSMRVHGHARVPLCRLGGRFGLSAAFALAFSSSDGSRWEVTSVLPRGER